ncbi:MAG: hypothetical protein ACXVC1_00695 [Tumebacillaceae bacterium]
MLQTIKIYYRLCVHRKSLLLLTALLLFLALLRVVFLNQRAHVYALDVNLWDYLLFSLGGVHVHDSLIVLVGWVLSLCPLLFFNYNLFGENRRYDSYLVARIGSRWRCWVAKMTAHLLVALSYGCLLLLIHLVVGLVFYSGQAKWSSFFVALLPEAASHGEPFVLFGYLALLLLTGMLAFAQFTQFFATVFRYGVSTHLVWTVLIFVASQLYVFHFLPRLLSPMMYASAVDLLMEAPFSLRSLVVASVSNLLVVLLLWPLGYVAQKKWRFD